MPRQALPLKLTYEDYVAIPDDGLQHEIIDGEHYVTPAPTLGHQWVASCLGAPMAIHASDTGLGWVLFAPVDVVLSPHDVVQPDLLFVSAAKFDAAISTTPRYLGLPPDLVIEVLSPSTSRKDRDLKLRLYERTGVPEYWLIDSNRAKITMYQRTPSTASTYATPIELSAENHDVLATPLLPGWSLPLSKLRL